MPFQYKKVLVIGATSGIGKALASRIVQEGSSVVVVGRRKENLEAFVHEHGKDKASAVPFDITELEKIPNFVTNITKTYPDLDCVMLNSGIQRTLDFAQPESVDMDIIQIEFTTNYLSNLALTKALLPFLQGRKEESALIYTTSSLALVPLVRCPNYCASKAAMHSYILCLREQLKGSSVKVVELFPPAVQTELHNEKNQPNLKSDRHIGIPLDQFTDEAYEGLAAGSEEVAVGAGLDWHKKIEPARQEIFQAMHQAMQKG